MLSFKRINMNSVIFAGRELAGSLAYLKNQGKENKVAINYPKSVEPLVRLYISFFGIPEIGLQERFAFFQRSINQILLSKKAKIIVDAGCGNGIHARYLAKRLLNTKIYALDIDRRLIRLNNQILPSKNIFFIKHDVTKPLAILKNKVDLLYCFDVLEHLMDFEKAINNFNSMIKKGGYLIIHVPLRYQKRWFSDFKKWEHQTHEYEGIEENELANLLRKYIIVEKSGTFKPFGALIWEINMLLLKKLPFLGICFFPLLKIIMLFDRLIPANKYNCLGIVAKKIS